MVLPKDILKGTQFLKYTCCQKMDLEDMPWIFLEDIETAYNPQKAHYEVSFYLPKGAYATNVICFLKGI